MGTKLFSMKFLGMKVWLVAAIMAVAALPQPARAATLAVLHAYGDKIYLVNSDSGKLVDTLQLVSPVGPITMNSIAVRPADGRLIGVTNARFVVEINAKTGAVMTLGFLPLGGLPPSSLACDPTGALCRLISYFDAGQATFDPAVREPTVGKKLKYAKGSGQPRVAAIAYTNAAAKAKSTQLFDVDVATKSLYRQNGDGGKLAKIGKLGVNLDSLGLGFAIEHNKKKKTNAGHLVFKQRLYKLDLKTGKASGPKLIKGLPNDIKAMVVLK